MIGIKVGVDFWRIVTSRSWFLRRARERADSERSQEQLMPGKRSGTMLEATSRWFRILANLGAIVQIINRIELEAAGSIAQLHHKQMARPRLTGAMQKQATRRACWRVVSYAGTMPRVTQPRTGNIAACTSSCRRLIAARSRR